MVKIDIIMPTYCYDCPCHNGENGRCNITGDSVYDKRPFDCPLREDKSTTDDEEVKHGEWIPYGKWTSYLSGESRPLAYDCSICALRISNDYDRRSHFCPNCGAKMNGKESGE